MSLGSNLVENIQMMMANPTICPMRVATSRRFKACA